MAATQATVLALTASGVGRRSSLILGIAALVLWAVSWSWLLGVGVTVVRVAERWVPWSRDSRLSPWA